MSFCLWIASKTLPESYTFTCMVSDKIAVSAVGESTQLHVEEFQVKHFVEREAR